MAYIKTVWVDETPDTTPVKYKITDDTAGVVAGSATIELVTPVTPGTPINAQRLNHLETGVFNNDAAITALQVRTTTLEAVKVPALDARLDALEDRRVVGLWRHTSWDGDAKSASTKYLIPITQFARTQTIWPILPSTGILTLQVRLSATWATIDAGSYLYLGGVDLDLDDAIRQLSIVGQVPNRPLDACGWIWAFPSGDLALLTGPTAPAAVTIEIMGYTRA